MFFKTYFWATVLRTVFKDSQCYITTVSTVCMLQLYVMFDIQRTQTVREYSTPICTLYPTELKVGQSNTINSLSYNIKN